MAMSSLPPGFRFHPTDVELVMYYLKRKVMGKRLRFEAIAEVNIYKFSPWDLPDKSCLKTKDLEWYFFCPREKKYASGGRVKRATENGYWKTTGKDRPIRSNDRTVGTVKTLVFHLGNAPQGERTDWVIHEYRILDNQLAMAGIQDTYVLCKIFKKAGLGPMNGAQYGAPFNEAEWSEDDVADTENQAIPIASDLPPPTTQTLLSGLPLTDGGPPSAGRPISEVLVDDLDDEITCFANTESQAIPMASDLPPPTTQTLLSGLPLTDGGPPSAGRPISEVLVDDLDDDITRLLAQFTDDYDVDENGANQVQVNLNTKGNGKSLSSPEEDCIFNGLGDLGGWATLNDDGFISGMQKGSSFHEYMGLNGQAYIEMNDFLTPLNGSTGEIEPDRAFVSETVGSYCNHYNIPKLHWGSSVSQHASCSYQHPALPEQSYKGTIHVDKLQMVNNHDGFNGAFELGIAERQLMEGDKFQGMERGTHRNLQSSRLMDSIPALTPSAAQLLFLLFYSFGGSSMHIKAEVTHGAGECTKEALVFMMEGSSSCWCNLPLAVSQEVLLWPRNHLLYLVDFTFPLVLVYFCLNEKLFISRSYIYFCEIENFSLYLVMPKVCYTSAHIFFNKVFCRTCTI